MSVLGHLTDLVWHGARRGARLVGLDPAAARSGVQYGWTPPPDRPVYDGQQPLNPQPQPGWIHQTAFAENPPGGPDVQGVYVAPVDGWNSMIWRWADTNRQVSIVQDSVSGKPAYRVELAHTDRPDSGTSGDHPRAELFSVDAWEKSRHPEPPGNDPMPHPPRPNALQNGDEYWATFAVRMTGEFPATHRWATLFQRKLDDRFFDTHLMTWLSINVQEVTDPKGTVYNRLSASIPGYPAFPGDPGGQGAPDDLEICTLAAAVGRWIQITVHETLSTVAGTADVTVESGGTTLATLTVLALGENRPTLPAPYTDAMGTQRDVVAHFQYGYYRDNGCTPHSHVMPCTGVVHHAPMLIKLGPDRGDVPLLP